MLLFGLNTYLLDFFKNLKIKMYKTITLPVVLYGCEAWSLTLWEERKLRVFENRILRRMFGPKGGANGDWRRFHHEVPHIQSDKSRRLRWTGRVARMEEVRSSFKILTGEPTGKRPSGRPRRR